MLQEQCKFNHDFERKKISQVCKYYLTDSCHKGDKCLFMHSEYPCKYFHIRKLCYNNSNCNFSHEPLNEEGQRIIDDIKRELSEKKAEKMHEVLPDDQFYGHQNGENLVENPVSVSYGNGSDEFSVNGKEYSNNL